MMFMGIGVCICVYKESNYMYVHGAQPCAYKK